MIVLIPKFLYKIWHYICTRLKIFKDCNSFPQMSVQGILTLRLVGGGGGGGGLSIKTQNFHSLCHFFFFFFVLKRGSKLLIAQHVIQYLYCTCSQQAKSENFQPNSKLSDDNECPPMWSV